MILMKIFDEKRTELLHNTFVDLISVFTYS